MTDWSMETVVVVGGHLVELAILAGRKVGLWKGPQECGGEVVYRNIITRSPRQVKLVFEDFQFLTCVGCGAGIYWPRGPVRYYPPLLASSGCLTPSDCLMH